MALIPCPECGVRVSDRASSCPQCGMGIAGTRVHVELTSKRLKIQQALATLLTLVALIWWMVGCSQALDQESEGPLILPTVLMLIGTVWLATTRVRIWWRHR